jgi:hypothetical protein
MHWWVLIPVMAAAALLVCGLYWWASGDPGVDAERAKEQFRAEQDWRGLRRAGDEVTPSSSREEVKLPG